VLVRVRQNGTAAVLDALRQLNRNKMRESFGPAYPVVRR
jgi:hypothetical protein